MLWVTNPCPDEHKESGKNIRDILCKHNSSATVHGVIIIIIIVSIVNFIINIIIFVLLLI